MATQLDNPLWSSLTTLHRAFALGAGELRRYPAEVAPFLAVPGAGAAPQPSGLAGLIAAGETVFSVGPGPVAPPGFEAEELGVILQMICAAPPPVPEGPPVVELGAEHADDVRALAALVYPHYFRPRTAELGRYFGVLEGGGLAAMIGERMGFPGHREISAVCTHPDFTGSGLARRLLAFLGRDIAARGDVPFLHVSPSNARAIELYERNGYATRTALPFTAIRRR
jgi:GNAT superfamily N-acetyltransferase